MIAKPVHETDNLFGANVKHCSLLSIFILLFVLSILVVLFMYLCVNCLIIVYEKHCSSLRWSETALKKWAPCTPGLHYKIPVFSDPDPGKS